MQVARKYVVRRRKEKFNPWHVSFWRYIASYLGHGAWSKPGRCKYLMSCWVQSIVLRAVHGIINPWPCVLDLLSPHPTPLLLRPSPLPPFRTSNAHPFLSPYVKYNEFRSTWHGMRIEISLNANNPFGFDSWVGQI